MPDVLGHDDFGVIDPNICGGTRTVKRKAVTPYTGTPCGKACKQVTFGNFVELHYEVVGDILVYVGQRSVTPKITAGSSKVYYVDLKTGKEWRLHGDLSNNPATGAHGCKVATTDGKVLAYTCVRDGLQYTPVTKWLQSVTTWDPATQVEKDLHCAKQWAADQACGVSEVAMGSTGIALRLSLTNCIKSDAQLYRFSDGSFKNVSKQYGSLGYIHMSGSRMVWARSYSVELYDTLKGTTSKVDSTKSWQCHSRIEGDKVVWTDLRNSTYSCYHPKKADIYLRDLSTGKTIAVTTHSAQQMHPDVDGDWVAWEDYRNNSDPNPGHFKAKTIDIYAKNLSTGKEYKLTSGPGRKLQPRVAGQRVFYRMLDAKKRASVFMVDLKALLAP